MGIFGKDPTVNTKEKVREWTGKIRTEMRGVDRQIRGIQREEEKVKNEIKKAAKKGDRDVCRVLAMELVRSHKAISKMYESKAQMNSIILNMNNQLATLRMVGSLQKSSEEMTKAGIIEELIDETVASTSQDSEDMEEEMQQEVDKILHEVLAGEMERVPQPITEEPVLPPAEMEAADAGSEPEKELEVMKARLEALRS
ncbi:unnamed protein product [Soboliphyme baturini]|uniref:Charged multivesicular body protein 3 n=1 Tax=Soboliphyme baturini TaxID=241478 RepID=A0A183J5H9_9BILA|nr:unnamed protein product [Soboliphyme baturini]